MKSLFPLLFIFVFSPLTFALSADEIVKKSELAAYYAGDDGRTAARMLIFDNQGRKQVRQFTLLRKDQQDGGTQDMLVFFTRPSDVRGTVFRVVKQKDSDDSRWLYLPDLDLVKRISAGDKRTYFVGSHFYYEDVSGRNTSADNHTLLKEDTEFYYIESTPKIPSSVEFQYYRAQIDKNTFLPMRVDFYDEGDKPYRTVEAIKVEQIENIPTVTHSKITDHKAGGYTELQFRFMKYDIGLPDSLFSERSMRKPPSKWLNVK